MAKIEDPWSDPWGDAARGDAGPPKRQRASKAKVEDDPWGEQLMIHGLTCRVGSAIIYLQGSGVIWSSGVVG